MLIVRESNDRDLPGLLNVGREAFGDDEGPEIVELISGLLADPTAKPLLSLVAVSDERVVGHILFTRAEVSKNEKVTASILAPLAVAPHLQKQGIGARLVKEGLKKLSESGTDLVFVLGHPDYYPRYGFIPASLPGYEAPYPIPEEVAGAWMVQELKPGIIGRVKGKVQCAGFLDRPDYWRE
jgi:putative acetyltransferase